MLKYFLIVCKIFIVAVVLGQSGQDMQDLERHLDELLRNKDHYHKKREDAIKKIKDEALRNSTDKDRFFEKNYELFATYKKFQTDSALNYLLKCKNIALSLSDSIQTMVDLDLVGIHSTIGQYIEARDLLNTISRQTLPKGLLVKYFDTYSSFYSHYGQSNSNSSYYQQSEQYRDSLLLVLDSTSTAYRLSYATKILFSGDRPQAERLLKDLLQQDKDNLEQKAIVSYLLGLIYKREKKVDLQKYYYTISACADMELANKDNASLQDLALTYYELGDVDRAFRLIEKAIDDAMFCNVRYRIIEGTSFYPIINAAYQKQASNQNEKLRQNLYLITLLLFILMIGFIIIYKQFSRLDKIKRELSATNAQLIDLNEQINKSNVDLSEANHIKEEYIAQFFDMCSAYIEKIDSIRKVLLKKASNNQIPALIDDLKSTTIVEQEVSELYHNFDSIFLNLYPSFVEDFNSLLKSDERIYPKKGELLNTELRIFALIRLGIDDSVKIASFLRYSLRTVYNYRTKVRNKAAASRTEFEDKVKQIAVLER